MPILTRLLPCLAALVLASTAQAGSAIYHKLKVSGTLSYSVANATTTEKIKTEPLNNGKLFALFGLAPADWAEGVGWAVLSAFGQGVGAVISRKAFAVAGGWHQLVDPGTAAYQRGLGGLLFGAIFVLALRGNQRGPQPPSGRAWPWVLGNALTGPVLGVTCFQWALRTTPAGIVQPIVAAAPLLTIPFAARLEGSRPHLTYYFGAVLAVAGVTALILLK